MPATRIIISFFILISFTAPAFSQIDSLHHDSVSATSHTLEELLKKNKYLNLSTARENFISQPRTSQGKELLFYLLGTVILLFGMFKVFYTKYFNNIFRVFFNTSLRQNQLTELLLQSTLPSLIFNIFFICTTGLYAWLILSHYHPEYGNRYMLIGICVLLVGLLYAGKFFALKFIGWISGFSPAIDQYIFVIFLINKIIGIILIPFIVLLAFAPAKWINPVVVTSAAILGILFLLRYLRSYGLLKNQLRVNRFHFLLYIIAVEILPVMVICKLLIRTF